ncbi:STAS domain-containing protein [Streptomyces abyssomicinicus]|uniref:STAS domain-containing protein n=1 Tax=Streptomyces abyssomicinicus TaxID=574929 RepID=UPI00124FDE61|nr:STAS domain-containing protein [Streptomyces abyssomicinicus]
MQSPERTAAGAPAPASATAAPHLAVRPLPEGRGVTLAGEVGLATRAVWTDVLAEAVEGGRSAYVLELSEVAFVDVAGAEALAAAARRLETGRRIVLHDPPRTLSRVLEMYWPGLPGIEVPTP